MSRLINCTDQVELRNSHNKSEVMTLNDANPLQVKVYDQEMKVAKDFVYLGNTIRHDGVANCDNKNCQGEAKMPSGCWEIFENHFSTAPKVVKKNCVLPP